jgi:hypothetical protein
MATFDQSRVLPGPRHTWSQFGNWGVPHQQSGNGPRIAIGSHCTYKTIKTRISDALRVYLLAMRDAVEMRERRLMKKVQAWNSNAFRRCTLFAIADPTAQPVSQPFPDASRAANSGPPSFR